MRRLKVKKILPPILLTLVLVRLSLAAGVSADSTAGMPSWTVEGTGPTVALQAPGEAAARDSVLIRLVRQGHYFARIDSIRAREGGEGGTVFATAGPRYHLAAIEIDGAESIDEQALLHGLETRIGEPLIPDVLEADVGRMLLRYERAGRPLAAVEIAGIDLLSDPTGALRLRLRVEEGPVPMLSAVSVEGDARTRPGYLARVAGVRPGAPLRQFEPDELRARLEATGFYRTVGEPELRVLPDSSVTLVFPLEEAPPGAFDLVLGFLPPTTRGESLGIVGNGHLELNNLFGGGRVFSLQLDRLPDRASSVDVLLSDPFIFGFPIGVEAQFSGLQQDSSYAKQRYALETSVRLALGMEGFITAGREVTQPGVGANESVARADAWFAGVGARVRRVDDPRTPVRGYAFEIRAESGRKSLAGVTGPEATADQERIRATARLYQPVLRRQILVLGVDAASLLRGARDQSDLLRFGGATTLRGYDEDRFLARTAARALAEYRYLLDPTSFAFAFIDVGYVETPELPGVAPLRGVYPGYGIGMRFETAVGLVSASYALSSEAGPTNGRIHVGLSFGL